MQRGARSWGRLSAPGGAGQDLRPLDAHREGPEPAPAPRPGQASPGHSPPSRWPPQCAPRPPSPSCPPGSPRAGGGNRRPRLDSASLEAGSSGGGVGHGGKERATRCVGQRSSGQWVTPRGARAGGGAGGRNPRPEAAGRGARTVWCSRRGGGLPAWEGPVILGESGASGYAREVSQRSGLGARWDPEHPGPVSLETGLGCLAAPLAGGFQECAVGVGAFRTSPPTLLFLTEGKQWQFIQTLPFADFLERKNFNFCSLQSSKFLKQNLEFGCDGPTLGPQIHAFLSPSLLVSNLPPSLPHRLNHILERAKSFVGWAPP